MRIVIDGRETELFNKSYEALLKLPEDAMKRIEIVREDLPIGDVLIQNQDHNTVLVIERKTFPDLVASVKDGRYEEQSHRLTNTTGVPPHSIIYLLEGLFSTTTSQHKKLIFSCMTSLNYYKGFSVLRTGTIYETGELLVAITEKIDRETLKGRIPYVATQGILPTNTITPGEPSEKGPEPTAAMNYCNFVKKVKKENITPENIGEIVLTQIPGISSVIAIAIMKKFSTFPKMLAALRENPDCMDDIVIESNGKSRKITKCIENIKRFFGE